MRVDRFCLDKTKAFNKGLRTGVVVVDASFDWVGKTGQGFTEMLLHDSLALVCLVYEIANSGSVSARAGVEEAYDYVLFEYNIGSAGCQELRDGQKMFKK